MTPKQQVLFIQGAGERVHDEWDDKLVASLRRSLPPQYELRYPRMPDEANPSYASWATAIRSELAGLADDAILIGHSLGGTILIQSLAEQPPPRRVSAIVLIAAPFVGDGGWQTDEWTPQRDLGEKLPPGVPVHLFHGAADATAPVSHLELFAKAMPQARVHRLPGRDHQLDNDLREVGSVIEAIAAER